MMYEATYDDLIISVSTGNVPMDGCSALLIENIGSDDAVINRSIPLAAGAVREFNNLPNEVIKQPFRITFTSSVAPKILIIRKFSKAIR